MPILSLQKRARELGRIRIGQKGDKGQPQKLDRFRVTSASKPLIDKVADLYGGTVNEWTPQGGAQQWEVITDARRIPILVPPQPVSQWLETWAGGSKGCIHRCDGVTNMLTGEPCDPDSQEHLDAKPTTRLNVILRDVEGIGVFRLESHGWNAAVELPDVAQFLAQAGGYVNGWLSLEERVSKTDGQTRRYIVPTIEIDVTPAQLLAGGSGVAAPSVEGPVKSEPKALESGTNGDATSNGAGGRLPTLEDIAKAGSRDAVANIWRYLKSHEALTPELEEACSQRAADLVEQTKQQPPAGDADDGDEDAIWQQIVTVAGEQNMTLPQLEEDFAKNNGGVVASAASAAELQHYLRMLQERAA